MGYKAAVSGGLFQNCHDLEKMDLEECILVSGLSRALKGPNSPRATDYLPCQPFVLAEVAELREPSRIMVVGCVSL